jgi:hypothetical protein
MIANNEITVLTSFLSENGNKPYRELVEKAIRKLSPEKLKIDCEMWRSSFPPRLSNEASMFIRKTNLLVVDEEFWKFATCQSAHNTFIHIAVQILPIEGMIATVEDSYAIMNQQLALNLYSMVTVNFAVVASENKEMRKAMMIKKGLIFR